jgi:hypothetical protein
MSEGYWIYLMSEYTFIMCDSGESKILPKGLNKISNKAIRMYFYIYHIATIYKSLQ